MPISGILRFLSEMLEGILLGRGQLFGAALTNVFHLLLQRVILVRISLFKSFELGIRLTHVDARYCGVTYNLLHGETSS
jgi:hypothetical protein